MYSLLNLRGNLHVIYFFPFCVSAFLLSVLQLFTQHCFSFFLASLYSSLLSTLQTLNLISNEIVQVFKRQYFRQSLCEPFSCTLDYH